MEQQLTSLDQDPDLTVVIRSGTEHFRVGQIELIVRGDGTARVEQQRNGQHRRFDKKVDTDRLERFGRALIEYGFTRKRQSVLPREPGDTPLTLALRRGEQTLFQANLWLADRYEDADLNAIFEVYEEMVFDVTAGELGHARR